MSVYISITAAWDFNKILRTIL